MLRSIHRISCRYRIFSLYVLSARPTRFTHRSICPISFLCSRKMDVNLDIAVDYPSSYKAIFNVLKATLEYPASPEAKAKKLADDITFFCTSAKDDDPPFWEIWPMVIALASNLPTDHEWQDSLILSLSILRQRDGSVNEENKLLLWKDLPDLSMSVAEYWNSLENPSNVLKVEGEVLVKWRNFNSFLARFSSPEFAPWLSFSIWQLQEALEEPPAEEQSLTDCRVWVASEWIIRCTNLLHEVMHDKREIDLAAKKPGTLCNDVPPQSIERWEFWKKRLSEIVADPSSWGLETATTKKALEALNAMKNLV
ncbi:hypothetical protein BGZ63DRAFT_455783 [Mariannaea sp. PMI_226]|nr:hypothetical protein BGZ63DRAFT_455783 [Mariannaea sp. PMI_226]